MYKAAPDKEMEPLKFFGGIMTTCNRCQQESDTEASYCPYCGTDYADPEADQRRIQQSQLNMKW